jgi:hypothetical protein
MKYLTKYLVYALLIASILTQCDSVSSSSDQTDLKLNEPTRLAIVSQESLVTELSWEQIRGAKTYRILISESDKFETSVVDTTITGTSFTTPPLSPQTTYSWKVYPIKRNQSGPWSNVWNFTTGPGNTTTPSAVTLISPVDGADKVSTNLEFTWNTLSETSEYTFQLSDNSTFSSVITEESIADTSYTPEGLVHQKKYHWRVKVSGDTNGDTWSETRSFTTGTADSEPESPSAVTLISPADGADKVSTNLEFTWSTFSGASEYTYQLSDNSTFSSVITEKTVAGTSYEPEGLLHQKKYHWRVKVSGDTNGDTWSETRSFTTGPADTEPESPAAVTLISPADGADKVSTNLKFTWNALSGVSEYTYQLSDNSTFSSVITKETVAGTSYEPEGLLHQKKYHWRVKVSGDTNGDSWSETRSFTTGPADTEPESPAAVTLISPVDGADKVSTNLEFTWNALSGVSEYTYQLSDNSTFSSVITEETVAGTSYKPEGLLHQKKYHWRVKVSGDNEGKTWSETRTFTTGTTGSTDPGTSTTVTLVSPADNAFDLPINPGFEWEEVFGAGSYEFQLADNSSFSPLNTESVEFGATHQASNLNYQTKYFWRVRVSGDSNPWSLTRSFTTKSEAVNPPPPTSGSFVQVHNSNFVLNGNVMHFAGTNAYYLPNYEKLNPAVVDRAMDLFRDTGITVIRMWGFYDGYDCGYSKNDSSENVIQTSPGVYSESALRDLDSVIAKGKERGVGFIIPFINFWDELGGICQYNTWAGASNPSTNMAFFLSNSNTQKWYKDYIKMLLNRVNTVTGIAYKDEPAIVAWQIMNEGRNRGADPQVLRNWYQEIAQYIKSIDPNHLVSTGEEGFDEGTPSVYSVGEYSNTYALRANEGTSYVLNTAIPEIDFGSAHWYPNEFGFGTTINDDLLRAQRAWLSDHKNIANSHGKPLLIGEFGFPGWGDERVSTMYNALYEHAESIRLDGNLLWQLTADGTKCWEFGGNICYPGGRTDTGLYNNFRNHVTNLKNLR